MYRIFASGYLSICLLRIWLLKRIRRLNSHAQPHVFQSAFYASGYLNDAYEEPWVGTCPLSICLLRIWLLKHLSTASYTLVLVDLSICLLRIWLLKRRLIRDYGEFYNLSICLLRIWLLKPNVFVL